MLLYDAEFRSQLDSSTVKCILKALNAEQLQWTDGKVHQQSALSSEDDSLYQTVQSASSKEMRRVV
jgi:hypothetical protein